MRLALLSTALFVLAAPLSAQEYQRPADWKVRFDRPAPDSSLYFVDMPPGWHITTGPASILYNPANQVRGNYRVDAKIHLFPGDRREGFGVFIAGKDLDNESQSYLYFLIRKDGRYLVKSRTGSETHEFIPWTENSYIVPQTGGEDPVENVLSIEASEDEILFLINGGKIMSLDRDRFDADGIVGLRVNHNLNLHVEEFNVGPLGG
jgi:hypothetical protein